MPQRRSRVAWPQMRIVGWVMGRGDVGEWRRGRGFSEGLDGVD